MQNAAHLLDGLVKDVVSEAFHDAEDDERVRVTSSRNVGDLVWARVSSRRSRRAPSRAKRNALRKRRGGRLCAVREARRVLARPHARQFLIGWIVALDATPQMARFARPSSSTGCS